MRSSKDLYLDLLKRCLTNTIYQDGGILHNEARAFDIRVHGAAIFMRGVLMARGVTDRQVKFLKGWFCDTLPGAPIRRLAVLRMDGDLYESTMDALTHLYPRLERDGYAIVDDYGDVPGCRQAVTEYREAHGIRAEIVPIDQSGVLWRKE